MEWQDVYVFISSTFNDMHAERDYLLKKVFPELSAWCAERRLRLVDIDLRWGVTSADARANNTVGICLENVDRCRPFFLCFLGQRRGWVPCAEDINSKTSKQYPGLAPHIGKSAVTEMEIEHALLSPMQRIVVGAIDHPEPVEGAVFFVRDDGYVADLNPDQLRIFTNIADPDPAESDALHDAFVDRVRTVCDDVYDYCGTFHPEIASPELSTVSATCAQGRLTDFEVDDASLHDIVLESLKRKILQRYPDRAVIQANTPQEREIETQAQLLKAHIDGAIVREDDIEALTAYCADTQNKPLLICSNEGSGKSTSLSVFFEQNRNSYTRSFMRYCATSALSRTWAALWSGILQETGIECSGDPDAFDSEFPQALNALSKDGTALVLIDGIDMLDEGLSVLSKLPAALPENLRLILTFDGDSQSARVAVEHASAMDTAQLYDPGVLADEDMPALVNAYLKDYLKALDDEQLQRIISNPAARNPLFLKVLLRELRIFGSFEQLDAEIASFGSSPASAFEHVLERLESDVAYTDIASQDFIPCLFGMLSLVRGSIAADDLAHAISKALGTSEQCTLETLAYAIRQMRPYLALNGARLGIAYDALRKAAQSRYGAQAQRDHEHLAQALQDTEPIECLYHLRMAGDAERVAEMTGNVAFLCACIEQAGAFPLRAELVACANWADAEVVACMKDIAPLIDRDPQAAPALFYKELASTGLREQARALCKLPYLRYEPLKIDPPQQGGGDDALQVRLAVEHHLLDACAADTRRVFFALQGECEIRTFDLATGRLCNSFMLETDARIKSIFCTDDASLLAAVSINDTLMIYRIALDDENALVGCTLVAQDTCAKIRFGGICCTASGNTIAWQRADGMLCTMRSDDPAISEQNGSPDRLIGSHDPYLFWKSDAVYMLTCGNTSTFLSARINDCALFGGKLYVAIEDRKIIVLDPGTLEQLGSIEMPEPCEQMLIWDDKLYMVDKVGRIFVIGADRHVQSLGRIAATSDVLDADARLIALDDASIAFLSLQRLLVLESGASASGRLMRIYALEDGYSALWMLGSSFTVTLPDAAAIEIERPPHLGTHTNWFENLKLACSAQCVLYESDRGTLRLLSQSNDRTIDAGSPICQIVFVPDMNMFAALTHGGTCLFISAGGTVEAAVKVAHGESETYQLEVCGSTAAVLSRRVRVSREGYSAIIVDMLSLIDPESTRWSREQPLGDRTVQHIVYNKSSDKLHILEWEHIETLLAPTSEIMSDCAFHGYGLDAHAGAVCVNDTIFAIDKHMNTLETIDPSTGSTRATLSTHRRTTWISGAQQGVLVIENDEKLYIVTEEKGV